MYAAFLFVLREHDTRRTRVTRYGPQAIHALRVKTLLLLEVTKPDSTQVMTPEDKQTRVTLAILLVDGANRAPAKLENDRAVRGADGACVERPWPRGPRGPGLGLGPQPGVRGAECFCLRGTPLLECAGAKRRRVCRRRRTRG